MRNKFALALALIGALLEKVPGLSFVPLHLCASDDDKKLTIGEQLSAWLREKESMAADLKSAKEANATLTTGLAAAKQALTDAQTAHAAALKAEQDKSAALATDLAAAQASNATATTGYTTLMDTLGFKPAELIVSAENCAKYGVAQDEAFNKLTPAAQQSAIVKAAFAHAVGARATAQVAEMGIDPKKLPPQSTTSQAESLEEIQSAMSTEKDPVKLGQLAAKANKLRDQIYASAN